MAVSQMKRLCVIAANEDADRLTEKLMWLSCVEISRSDGGTDDTENAALVGCTEDISHLNALSGSFKAAHTFLSPYVKKSRSLFGGRTQVKREVIADGFLDGRAFADTLSAVNEANELERKMHEAQAQRVTTEDKLGSLSPWVNCPIPLCGVKTASTVSVAGVFAPGTDVDKIVAEVEESFAVSVAVVNDDVSGVYCVATVLNDDAEDALRFISQRGFNRVSPEAAGSGTASEAERALQSKLISLAAVNDDYKNRALELAYVMPDIECFSDALKTSLARLEGKKLLSHTQRTVILKGWVPKKAMPAVTEELEAVGCAYEFTDPSEDDDVPVLFDNRQPASWFEPVVALYSLPKYGTFDPTAIMGVFYTVIFGLMFADVGYGLLLLGGCIAGLKLLKPSGSLEKFMKMFALCGISCIVMGMLFGGYFGDMPSAIATNMFGVKNFPELALWFNPMNDPMMFLIVSLAMGAIHLTAALCVKFYILWRAGKPLDAIFDVGSWLLLFAGIGVVFLFKTTGLTMIILGAAMLILTQGRAEKNPVMKLLKGILSLYDIVSYVSDLLSYSRILSLGLASAVIASVVNILATMSGLSFVGVIMALVIFALGHILNLVINALGSFVHTSRLQYIEFFGKFYEDGGRAFAPLEPAADYISLL